MFLHLLVLSLVPRIVRMLRMVVDLDGIHRYLFLVIFLLVFSDPVLSMINDFPAFVCSSSTKLLIFMYFMFLIFMYLIFQVR